MNVVRSVASLVVVFTVSKNIGNKQLLDFVAVCQESALLLPNELVFPIKMENAENPSKASIGNTSAATIPLAMWDNEAKLKKGDNIIFTAFGAGFVHGATYYKWAYDGDKVPEAKK